MSAVRNLRTEPEMASELAQEAAGAPAQPPGTYYLAGRIHIRRFGPVRRFDLVCRLGHAMKVGEHPREGVFRCSHHERPANVRCVAHIWLYKLPASSRYLLLDVTAAEATVIDRECLDLDQVLVRFNLDLPRIV